MIRVQAWRNELDRTKLTVDEMAPLWNRIGESFGGALNGMITGAQTWRSAFRRHGGDRHDASGNQRQCTRHTARGSGAASTRRSGDSPLGMPSQRYRLADCGPARA